MSKRHLVAALALFSATPVMASDLIARPVAAQGQTVRYDNGLPTIDDHTTNSAVSVKAAPFLDHGSLQFKVAVFNMGAAPINVGVENITLTHHDVRLPCFTKNELAHKAQKRALWSQIGYAMLAGVAAAGQNNNTTVTTTTPHGVYRTVVDRPGLSDGQIATLAAGGGAVALSQIGLQRTLEQLDDEVIQTTTIDPQSGYGGRIVLRKLDHPRAGDTVLLLVEAGGEVHTFTVTLVSA